MSQSIAFVFPGQGSQSVGMGQELYEAFPEARDVFDEVDDVLSFPLRRLMVEGPTEELSETRYTQPALMTVSAAVFRVLQKLSNNTLKPVYFAGHSLGEYSALFASGALTLRNVAFFLWERGQAMALAVPKGQGAMAALLKLMPEKLTAMPSPPSGLVCCLANDNSSGQVVISGHQDAVAQAMAWAIAEGGRAIKLDVSGPFHSPLMAPAAEHMTHVFSDHTDAFQAPSAPIITNVSAQNQTEPSVLIKHLVQQITGTVRWRETMQFMANQGIQHLVELGSGRVLAGLAKRDIPHINATSLHTPQDIEHFLEQNERKTHV